MQSALSASLIKRTDPSYSIVYNHCWGSTHKQFFAYSTIKFLVLAIVLWLLAFFKFLIHHDVGQVALQGIWILHMSLLVKALIDYLKFGEYGNSFAQVMSLNLLITVVIAFLAWVNLVLLYMFFDEKQFVALSGKKTEYALPLIVGSGFIVTYKLYTTYLYYFVISKRIKYLEYIEEKKTIALRHLISQRQNEIKVSNV